MEVHSIKDCDLAQEQEEGYHVAITEKLSEISKEYDIITQQIAQLTERKNELNKIMSKLEADQKKHRINIAHIEKMRKRFMMRNESEIYYNRCMVYITTNFTWADPNKREAEDNKYYLPVDMFSYLGLPFLPLEKYTTAQIKDIAHYLHTYILIDQVQDEGETMEPPIRIYEDTYAELIASSRTVNYTGRVISSIYNYDCTEWEDEGYYSKDKYAYTIEEFKDITLDSERIIVFCRI